MAPSIYLFEVLGDFDRNDQGAWKVLFEKRLESMAFNYERIGNRIRIWDPTANLKRTARKDVRYREGVEVFKVSMPRSYEHPVVGFNFARLYFIEGEDYPAHQSARELFNNREMPPVLRQLPLLDMLDAFIHSFNEEAQLIKPLESIDWNSISSNVLVEGEAEKSDIQQLSNSQYASAILSMVRNKAATTPVNFELALIDAFAADSQKAVDVATKTSSVLENEWGCHLGKKRISTSEQFNDWLNEKSDTRKVGFLALDGKKGERPAQSSLEWMKLMEGAGVPYVLFSAARDVNPVYTRHGNAMHILTKAGGRHYNTRPAAIPEYENHWFIGLDLGYGAQYKGKCVVITLSDHQGSLKCYWRALKDSDETLSENVLEEALSWILDQADSLKQDKKIVVIRDGRCPHHELVDTYKKLLPEGRTLFIEYTKKGNPLIIDGRSQPQPGTIAVPNESSEAFLFTARASQNGMLTNATRYRCRINDLGYSTKQVGEMLTSLCFAPKLSIQPSSIPAPIYWADGIASLSNVNLQFAGWGHLPHVTRDFRLG